MYQRINVSMQCLIYVQAGYIYVPSVPKPRVSQSMLRCFMPAQMSPMIKTPVFEEASYTGCLSKPCMPHPSASSMLVIIAMTFFSLFSRLNTIPLVPERSSTGFPALSLPLRLSPLTLSLRLDSTGL